MGWLPWFGLCACCCIFVPLVWVGLSCTFMWDQTSYCKLHFGPVEVGGYVEFDLFSTALPFNVPARPPTVWCIVNCSVAALVRHSNCVCPTHRPLWQHTEDFRVNSVFISVMLGNVLLSFISLSTICPTVVYMSMDVSYFFSMITVYIKNFLSLSCGVQET